MTTALVLSVAMFDFFNWYFAYLYTLQRRRLITHANAKSKSEKFPPPHQDGGLGVPLGASHHIDPSLVPPDVPFSSTSFTYSKEPVQNWSGPLVEPASAGGRRKKHTAGDAKKHLSKRRWEATLFWVAAERELQMSVSMAYSGNNIKSGGLAMATLWSILLLMHLPEKGL